MHSTPSHISFFLPLLGALFLTGTPLLAQNQLVANPEAVKLRRIWTERGQVGTFEQYGYNIWGGVDISGDDTADFAVHQLRDNVWYFYEGGNPPKTEPFWQKDSVTYVALSDFWNDGRRFMLFTYGYMEVVEDFSRYYDQVFLHEVTDTGVNEVPTYEIDFGRKEPALERFLDPHEVIYVLDINNDHINDVIIPIFGTRLDTTRKADNDNQVWIYFGGENFQLDEPDVIIRDTHEVGDANNWNVRFFDFDGNGQMDMLLGGTYDGIGDMIRFYWGDDNSPASWAERPPDRDLRLVHGEIGINSIFGLGIYDLDGDGAADLASQEYEDVAGVRVYLRSRKSMRTRSFTLEDADVYYEGDRNMNSVSAGSLNDSTGTYDMLPIGGRTQLNHYARYYVSGSPEGPNHDYEAWYVPAEDGSLNKFLFRYGGEIGDVNNDGWPDVGYSTAFDGTDKWWGIAVVLAGGPYIPFDDPSTVVEEVPIAGESGGLFLWPNPVVDVLQIAWRGNLKEKPVRFAVFDMVGREVISGTVDPYVGAARWDCASVASGAYILVAYAADDRVIATAEVLKQ